MKPDVFPGYKPLDVLATGDVAVVLYDDVKKVGNVNQDGEPFSWKHIENGLRRLEHPSMIVVLVIRPFGPLLPGNFLRFRSLTGETNWGEIADYCSIFDCARPLTEYAMKLAAGTRTFEHG